MMAGHKPWSELRKKMTPEQIARSEAKAEGLRIGMLLHDMRQRVGVTQAELADRLGISQQAVSKIEWGQEIQLSTLNAVIAALGGQVMVRTADQEEIELTH